MLTPSSDGRFLQTIGASNAILRIGSDRSLRIQRGWPLSQPDLSQGLETLLQPGGWNVLVANP
jgi:hypothetical protein